MPPASLSHAADELLHAAVEVVDALWRGEQEAFARASLGFRIRLERHGFDAGAARAFAGLLTMQAVQLLAGRHGVSLQEAGDKVQQQLKAAAAAGWALSLFS